MMVHEMTRVSMITGLLLAVILLPPGAEVTASDENDLNNLAAWMTGTFSTAVQASEDPEHLELSLHMAPVWTDRSDGRWIYVEQALSEYPDRPYRQRVYHLGEPASGLFEIRVFSLPNPPAVVGAWQEETPLTEFGPDDLELREGCEILLRRRGESFVGSTLASLCSSTLRDAMYAASEVLITPNGIVSRDRGFTEDGAQVWGPTGAGYVFDRIVDDPEVESTSAAEDAPEPVPLPDGSGSGSGSDQVQRP